MNEIIIAIINESKTKKKSLKKYNRVKQNKTKTYKF